jgi:ABC-2 type transport system permease protein
MTTVALAPPTPMPSEPAAAVAVLPRRVPQPIPLRRIVAVELRKSFDTRSGFWLLTGVLLASLVTTAAVILLAPVEPSYSTFILAIGFPMAIILPMIALLSVTAEWSQRSGLTTFALVPHRGRVVLAKAIVAVSVAVVSMLLAIAVGALGNVVGSALAGVDTVWDQSPLVLLHVVLANVLVLLVGFTLGVLIRNSAGAIVAYFVYAFALPTVTDVLAAGQQWFADLQPWLDPNVTQHLLFHGSLTAAQWSQLGVTSLIWLVIPLAAGVRSLLRSEIK